MNIKKLTKKGADGSSIIYEFDVPKMDSIPNHPGEPKGPDTVPAWLTPGEFVVNAEATRMFEPQIEAMNDAGKAVQRQQGGTIPQYKADGGGILSDDIPTVTNIPTVTTEEFINDTQSPGDVPMELSGINPGDVPMELSGINPADLLSQQRANRETRNIVTDEFGEGVLPGEGSRAVTTFTPPQNLAELTGGFLGLSEDVEKVRSQAQKDKAIANDITSVINNPDLTSETKNLNPKDAEEAGTKLINEDEKKEDVTGEGDKDSFLSKVSNFFTENFKDLIDDDKLMNAALLYAGSRALGYSHGGSLNFVGRNYLSDIQKKLAVADKASLSNKYTKDSVKKYRDTGKVEDLELAKNVQLVNSEMLVNDKGEQVRVNKYEDKNTGKTVYQTEDGKPVQRAMYSTQSEDNAGSDRVVNATKPIYESEIAKYKEINPELALKLPSGDAVGNAAYRLGVRYGLSPSMIGSKIESITKNMIKHVNVTGKTLSADSIEPFLTQEFLTASLKDMGVKDMIKGANTDALNALNGRLSANRDPIELASKYQGYAKEYKDIKDKQFFIDRSNIDEGITPLMVYITEQLKKPTS